MTQGVPESHLDLELLAAELRRHADDLSLYSAMLLTVLSAALPPELVQVRRASGWRARLAGRQPAVLGISVCLDDRRFDLDGTGTGGRTVTRICHSSGGVVLSSRPVPVEEWCHGLAVALVQAIGTDAAAVAALQRLSAP